MPEGTETKPAPDSEKLRQATIVVLDDEQRIVEILTLMLEKHYSVKGFTSPQETLQWLNKHPVDIILSDYVMPDMNGAEFLREAHSIQSEAKRVILTGKAELEVVVQSVNEAQIDFFLSKPVSIETLYRVVEKLWADRRMRLERDLLAAENAAIVEKLRDVNTKLEETVHERTQAVFETNEKLGQALEEIERRNKILSRLNQSLIVQATIDSLTGLYNRREFDRILTSEWGRWKRYGRLFSLVMLDLDHFKRVNDTHGHDCGDAVLRELGELLRKNRRQQDVISRYGGEEFIIIFPETSLEPAFATAEKIRQSVQNHTFYYGETVVPIQLCIGLAGTVEHNPRTQAELVKIADQGLYHAKQAGRNRTLVLSGLDEPEVLLEGKD